MHKQPATPWRWTTSAFGSPADTSPMDLATLSDHLSRCDRQRGAWFALRCAADAMHRFFAPRLMTTLLLFALLCAAAGVML